MLFWAVYQNSNGADKAFSSTLKSNCVMIYAYNPESPDKGAFGSGVLIKNEILTCAHVIRNAKYFYVKPDSGKADIYSTVLKEDRINDLALLACNLTGDVSVSDKIPGVTDDIWIIGSPSGTFNTVEHGYISGFRDNLIQLNAAIIGGHSGSPVFNKKGELVGIVNLRQCEGIGYMIPAERINIFLREK